MLISATFKLLAVLATASLAAARVCPSCPLEFKLTADYSKFITTLEGPNEPQEDGPRTCLYDVGIKCIYNHRGQLTNTAVRRGFPLGYGCPSTVSTYTAPSCLKAECPSCPNSIDDPSSGEPSVFLAVF
ncbi:hypothetical protein FIBSPDRAFT_900043 [Athelia psychrophila]|uniref:Uncharacterized protein n=1 Tax=Athelia psychrophila TaxID=1759441 RepID=A0A165YZ72_9AGAM|nr:hypothetical protein FIBSPDRAFT_900043 [Fibularhizoctonia sp. CBS 109695]